MVIKTIYHLADIHYRLYRRIEEYEEVLDKTYQVILKDTKNAIVVITGDLIHTKMQLSPEMIIGVSKFIKNLAAVLPVVIIAGNHDCNMSNKDRKDAISALIETNNIEKSNIRYLKDSGVYEYDNIRFGVSSILDGIWTNAPTDDDDKINIALYHGVVKGASINTGFVFEDRGIDINKFDGYDIAMLGDIHKHQVLQEYDQANKKPIVVYPGSLICQNFGESTNDHGLIKWNIIERSFEFIEIENDYAHVTLELKLGKLIMPDNIPSKARVRFNVVNSSKNDIDGAITQFKMDHTPSFITVNVITGYSAEDKKALDIDTINNINNVGYQNNLIEEFSRSTLGVTNKEVIDKLKSINEQLNTDNSVIDELLFGSRWTPDVMSWSNMFSYGVDNSIDFNNYNNVIGILGKNRSGKSSIVDILIFLLFDKTTRGSRGDYILNENSKEFSCSLSFRIGDIRFFIEKNGELNDSTGRVKVDVDFWKHDEKGKKVSLNGEQRAQTNANIREYIGTYDDFVATIASIQNDNMGFIKLTQSQRKDFLIDILRIDIFDRLYKASNKQVNELQYKTAAIDREFILSEIIKLNDKIKDNEEQSTNINTSIADKDKIINETLEQIHEARFEVKQVNIELLEIDPDNLISELTTLESEIKKYKQHAAILQKDLTETDKLVSNYKGILEQYNIAELKKLDKERTTLIENESDLIAKARHFKVLFDTKVQRAKNLKDLEYDPNCKFCMNNIFVKEAIKSKAEIKGDTQQLKDFTAQLSKLQDQISEYSTVVKNIEQYELQLNNLHDTESEIIRLKSEIIDLKTDISIKDEKHKKLSELQTKYLDNKATVLKNKLLNSQIETLNEKLAVNKELRSSLQDEASKLSADILYCDKILLKHKDSLAERELMNNELDVYKIYNTCVKRDGLPYYLMNKTIPALEIAINNLLSPITDFSVAIVMDGKNIDLKIHSEEDGEWPVEFCSGFEKFVIAVCIRVALLSISNLPKADIFIIDEGFGNLDADNLSSIGSLFELLKTQFSKIFVITHIESISGEVDEIINVTRDEVYSCLTN